VSTEREGRVVRYSVTDGEIRELIDRSSVVAR
jgi:hypothetical protein